MIRRPTSCSILLLISVACFGQSGPTIENNVLRRLKQLGLDGSVSIFAVGNRGDRVFANPVLVEGVDQLGDTIQRDKKKWIRSSNYWTQKYHGKGAESWRSAKKCSLQVTVHPLEDGNRFYELDIDKWPPKGVKTPVNSVRHLFAEVIWNGFTGHVTSQKAVEHRLDKIDARNSVFQSVHGRP